MIRVPLLLLAALAAAHGAPQFLPEGQALRYAVKAPDGAAIGEAQMLASRSGESWSLAFSLDASVPGFAVSDSYQSLTSGDFCSVELVKRFAHGARRGAEKTTFATPFATRETLGGGGSSRFAAPACARDALAFLFYLRRELAQGRRPASTVVYFGASYQLAFEYGGKEKVQVDNRSADADRVTVSVKGPASNFAVQVWFLRDAARTPVRIAVPLATGTFSLDLVR
jgi:hypothetical protein